MQREHWHLTEGLIFAHFAVFILSATMPGGQQALALFPGFIGARPWTLVTYQFVHGNSLFWFFISMLVLWIMARPIEESWGSPRFLVFWLISTFGASLTAAALARPLYGDVGFGTCLLFTFATLYPEVEFRLFFIIPVKVKYLAVIAAAILVYSSLSYGIIGGLANIARWLSGRKTHRSKNETGAGTPTSGRRRSAPAPPVRSLTRIRAFSPSSTARRMPQSPSAHRPSSGSLTMTCARNAAATPSARRAISAWPPRRSKVVKR
jgi:membrane associated rhomboid family serine protease